MDGASALWGILRAMRGYDGEWMGKDYREIVLGIA
jgi:hypothetical protein